MQTMKVGSSPFSEKLKIYRLDEKLQKIIRTGDSIRKSIFISEEVNFLLLFFCLKVEVEGEKKK